MDPTVGMFFSVTFKRYRYSNSNPRRHVDRDGLDSSDFSREKTTGSNIEGRVAADVRMGVRKLNGAGEAEGVE